jgi:hypothetical protein
MIIMIVIFIHYDSEFGLDTVRKLNIFWQKQKPALIMMEVSKTSHNHC